jgi:hypothetical protein
MDITEDPDPAMATTAETPPFTTVDTDIPITVDTDTIVIRTGVGSGTLKSAFTMHYASTLILSSGITIANGTTISNNMVIVEKNSTMYFAGALAIGTTVNVTPGLFFGNTRSQLLFTSGFSSRASGGKNTNASPRIVAARLDCLIRCAHSKR